MRLFIAEKPSLARAIAAAMPGQHRRSAHHIACANGCDVIAWCAGHVLEMAPPQDYAAAFETWTLETLPIVPQTWKHRVTAHELVDSIRKLLAKATRVVHAGDPDREGQMLVDEVLLHLGWCGATERLLITDLSPAAVGRALAALESNARYRSLYEAALARQRADWIYGLNLTRLYTLRARAAGYRGVVSVGRVQTPVLGLIVGRDREIENFVATPFFGVRVALRTAAGEEFSADWAVGKEHAARLDPDGRLLDESLAAEMAVRLTATVGSVTRHDEKPVAEEPPLPYSLATLQVDAGRKLGLSAARVLELAQRLYERQLLTYPRSDCTYLPEAHRGQAREVLGAVRETAPTLSAACAAAQIDRCGRAWADARVTAHHAIIPTARRHDGPLDADERALYELVARRYIQQFLPPFEYLRTRVEIGLAGELVVARGRRTKAAGWTAFDGGPRATDPDDVEEGGEVDMEVSPLPLLSLGQRLECPAARVLQKRTTPPKPFTDASIIAAMCNISRFVADPKARKILADTDGIGTPATRADIIERLVARGFVERRKKQLRSTPVGRALIAALPPIATTPDMTALWEGGMARIQDRRLELERFLDVVAGQLGELVRRGKAAGPLVLPQLLQSNSRSSGAARPFARSRKGARRPRRASAAVRGVGGV